MSKPVVIYHKDCIDGMTAAWCFWKQYGDTYEYYPGVYNEPPPDIFNRDVYMVDFSYKREIMQVLLQYAGSITLLDHHVGALEQVYDLKGLDTDHSTTSLSGAMIAWNYVKWKEKHNRKIPALIPHVQDRDLWEFKLPNTREIILAMGTYQHSFSVYDTLMKLSKIGLKSLVKESVPLMRQHQKAIAGLLQETVREIEIEGYTVPCANVPYYFASDIGDLLNTNRRFAATYYDTAAHRVFSLRSKKGFGANVKDIAAVFGGGGHENAAGFKVKRDHFLASV